MIKTGLPSVQSQCCLISSKASCEGDRFTDIFPIAPNTKNGPTTCCFVNFSDFTCHVQVPRYFRLSTFKMTEHYLRIHSWHHLRLFFNRLSAKMAVIRICFTCPFSATDGDECSNSFFSYSLPYFLRILKLILHCTVYSPFVRVG